MSLETPASENNPTIESDTINGADILMGEGPNSNHSMKLENIDNSGQLANPLTKFGDLTLTGLAVEVAFNDVPDGAELNRGQEDSGMADAATFAATFAATDAATDTTNPSSGYWKHLQNSFLERLQSEPLAETFETMSGDGSLDYSLHILEPGALHQAARRFAELPPELHERAEEALSRIDPKWATQMKLAVAGVPDRDAEFDESKYADLIEVAPEKTSDTYTGSGITGINPSELKIPPLLQLSMFSDHIGLTNNGTAKAYKNFTLKEEFDYPDADITRLSDEEFEELQKNYLESFDRFEMRSLEAFLEQPISTLNPDAFAGKIPSRADVIKAAGSTYGITPEILTAFLMTEQQEQSQNEDALDYYGATFPIFNRNTSVGLGQTQVDNARVNEGELLESTVDSWSRANLSRAEAAELLVSDEHGIFAAAKFIRDLANKGAATFRDPEALPKTRALFPHLQFEKFAEDSSEWTDDHLHILGAEYTSSPWDDDIKSDKPSTFWGRKVIRYRDMAYKSQSLREESSE